MYPEALTYFFETYAAPGRRAGWAGYARRFWRNHASTNLPIEKLHHLIKYIILQGIVNLRPGKTRRGRTWLPRCSNMPRLTHATMPKRRQARRRRSRRSAPGEVITIV